MMQLKRKQIYFNCCNKTEQRQRKITQLMKKLWTGKAESCAAIRWYFVCNVRHWTSQNGNKMKTQRRSRLSFQQSFQRLLIQCLCWINLKLFFSRFWCTWLGLAVYLLVFSIYLSGMLRGIWLLRARIYVSNVLVCTSFATFLFHFTAGLLQHEKIVAHETQPLSGIEIPFSSASHDERARKND